MWGGLLLCLLRAPAVPQTARTQRADENTAVGCALVGALGSRGTGTGTGRYRGRGGLGRGGAGGDEVGVMDRRDVGMRAQP